MLRVISVPAWTILHTCINIVLWNMFKIYQQVFSIETKDIRMYRDIIYGKLTQIMNVFLIIVFVKTKLSMRKTSKFITLLISVCVYIWTTIYCQNIFCHWNMTNIEIIYNTHLYVCNEWTNKYQKNCPKHSQPIHQYLVWLWWLHTWMHSIPFQTWHTCNHYPKKNKYYPMIICPM